MRLKWEETCVNRIEKDLKYVLSLLRKPNTWLGIALLVMLIGLVLDIMGIDVISDGQIVPLSRSISRYDHPDVQHAGFTLDFLHDPDEVSVMDKLDDSIARHNDLVLAGVYSRYEADYSGPVQAEESEWVTLRMRVTGYCQCRKCCGKHSDGYTANMHKIRWGDKFVAADKMFSFGREMIIPGYNNGRPVQVKDRGRLIKGYRLDVYFDTHRRALQWGTKYLNVKVKRKG
jgi:3D (Asp-Asp-Asp) domain-containing protein